MKKCKNNLCDNEIVETKTYCSLSCRNIYTNKNLRNYDKNAESLSKKTRLKYEQNPKYCLNKDCCKKISYEKRRNNFCNSSCQAKQTNRNRVITENTKNKLRLKYYEKNPKINSFVNCKFCNNNILSSDRRKFCSHECRINFKRVNMDDYMKYRQDTKFNFNLSDFPDEFDFELIKKHGWYKPKNHGNNLTGVSRDHIYSVNEGYKNKIDPKIISHPANCRLMIHSHNVSKNKKSDITIEQLIIKIKNWDKKYIIQ